MNHEADAQGNQHGKRRHGGLRMTCWTSWYRVVRISGVLLAQLASLGARADVESIRPDEKRPPGANPTASVVASVSLAQASYMVGEPIVATLTVYNYSDSPIYLASVDHAERGDVRFEMTDEAGKSVPIRQYWGNGVREWPRIAAEIDAHYKLVHHLVLSRWIDVSRPGRYTLTIRPQLRHWNYYDPAVKTPLAETFQLPVRITRTDSRRLAEIAERLRPINWENNASGHYQWTMLDQFTSVSDRVAAPFWLDALLHSGWPVNRSTLIGRLTGLGSREVIDMFATLWSMANRERNEVARSAARGVAVLPNWDMEQLGDEVRSALLALYTHGNPSLKSYVGAIFRAQEGRLPVPPGPTKGIRIEYSDGTRRP